MPMPMSTPMRFVRIIPRGDRRGKHCICKIPQDVYAYGKSLASSAAPASGTRERPTPPEPTRRGSRSRTRPRQVEPLGSGDTVAGAGRTARPCPAACRRGNPARAGSREGDRGVGQARLPRKLFPAPESSSSSRYCSQPAWNSSRETCPSLSVSISEHVAAASAGLEPRASR